MFVIKISEFVNYFRYFQRVLSGSAYQSLSWRLLNRGSFSSVYFSLTRHTLRLLQNIGIHKHLLFLHLSALQRSAGVQNWWTHLRLALFTWGLMPRCTLPVSFPRDITSFKTFTLTWIITSSQCQRCSLFIHLFIF